MSDNNFENLNENIINLSDNIKSLHIDQYIELLNTPKKMFYINFVWGLARGLGMAVGFTLLGALAIYILKSLVSLNLPLIGNFIAEIVKIVQSNL